MDREVQVGKIYRHFKGNYYRVILIAKHTETGEKMVVYQALYSNDNAPEEVKALAEYFAKYNL